jgi:hypothetical protein
MSYFKITMPKDPDMLPLYTQADKAANAKMRVERLLGPLKGCVVVPVEQKDIPENESIL